jgi:hypothetical protein
MKTKTLKRCACSALVGGSLLTYDNDFNVGEPEPERAAGPTGTARRELPQDFVVPMQ